MFEEVRREVSVEDIVKDHLEDLGYNDVTEPAEFTSNSIAHIFWGKSEGYSDDFYCVGKMADGRFFYYSYSYGSVGDRGCCAGSNYEFYENPYECINFILFIRNAEKVFEIRDILKNYLYTDLIDMINDRLPISSAEFHSVEEYISKRIN